MHKIFAVISILWLIVVVTVALITMHLVIKGNYENAFLLFVPVLAVGYPISRYLNHQLLHGSANK